MWRTTILAASGESGGDAAVQVFSPTSRSLRFLGEIVAQFLEEALSPGTDLQVLDFSKLPEQLLLAGGQVPRGFNDDLDQLVAPAPAADVGHAATLDSDHLTALRAAGNHDIVGTIERGNADLGPQRGLREADRNLAVQIVAPPFEEGVPLDHHLDAQVAPGCSDVSQFALVAKLQPHAAFHTRWNIDLQLGRRRGPAGASAARTGIGNSNSVASARRTGGRHLKEPACLNDLPASAAVVAGGGAGAFARARAAAFTAKLLAAHFNATRRAPRRLHKFDLQLHQQVRPGTGPAPALAEEVAEESAAENIAERRHDVVGRAEVVNGRTLKPGVAVAVVALPLFGIGEDLVGLGRFLEFFLGVLVTRIAVRVKLERQLPVGSLHVLELCVSRYPEHFIKIALGRGHRHGVSAVLLDNPGSTKTVPRASPTPLIFPEYHTTPVSDT